MENFLFFLMMLLPLSAMAQTSPRSKTPAQLASEMTMSIADVVTISSQQQTELTLYIIKQEERIKELESTFKE